MNLVHGGLRWQRQAGCNPPSGHCSEATWHSWPPAPTAVPPGCSETSLRHARWCFYSLPVSPAPTPPRGLRSLREEPSGCPVLTSALPWSRAQGTGHRGFRSAGVAPCGCLTPGLTPDQRIHSVGSQIQRTSPVTL